MRRPHAWSGSAVVLGAEQFSQTLLRRVEFVLAEAPVFGAAKADAGRVIWLAGGAVAISSHFSSGAAPDTLSGGLLGLSFWVGQPELTTIADVLKSCRFMGTVGIGGHGLPVDIDKPGGSELYCVLQANRVLASAGFANALTAGSLIVGGTAVVES